ncbi:sialoadhesin-like [Oncorhynchus masou masou]|uniref:sialoadhesin-like n=1 Tax=Oncorhynchus masou masou TaxID=90313 RepID=UPI0031839630
MLMSLINRKDSSASTTCVLTAFIMFQHFRFSLTTRQLTHCTRPLLFTSLYCRVGDATMALRTAGSVLVVFLWSVTVVLGQDGWSVTYTTQSICTLKGSTVELTCSYTYPRGKVTTTLWFTKMEAGIEPEDIGQDPEYSGRLEYHGDKKKDCTLRITDLRERDSATYKFRFLTDQEGGKFSGSPGVSLSVKGLQVKVIGGHQDKTLTCSTTCTLTDNPTYIWYKNGQHLDESTFPQYKDSVSNDYDASYSCAVKGHEDLHSPAVCVQGQSCNRVTYTKRRICVLKGSTVDISCTYVGYYYTKSSFWFRSDKSTTEDLTTDPGYAGRVEYTGTYRGPFTLRITDLREEDSAEYRFTFKTDNIEWGHSIPGTTLSVADLQLKGTPAAEGQKTLTCITTCTLTDNPTYIWYKNGQHLDESTSPQYKDPVSSNYEDSYSCAVKGHEDLHSPLRRTQLSIASLLKHTTLNWGHSFPGTTLSVTGLQVKVTPAAEGQKTLTCSTTCTLTDNPTYIWYKNGQNVQGVSSPMYSISSEDADSYFCAVKGRLSSPAVYKPKTSVSVSPSGEIVEGSSVTLTCSSDANPPVQSYTWWYKKNGGDCQSMTGPQHVFSHIQSSDSGEYYCESQNEMGTDRSGTINMDVKEGDSSPVYDNISNMAMTSTAAQTADTDNQDDVHYASVHFSGSKNQEVPLYSTVQVPQPQKEDEDVQYAALKFNLPCAATRTLKPATLMCQRKHLAPGDCVTPDTPQESLERNGTRTSLPTKPSPNPEDAGPVIHRLMGLRWWTSPPLMTPVMDLSSPQDSSGRPLLSLDSSVSPLRTPVVDLSSPLQDSSVMDISSPQDSSSGSPPMMILLDIPPLRTPVDSSGGPLLPS